MRRAVPYRTTAAKGASAAEIAILIQSGMRLILPHENTAPNEGTDVLSTRRPRPAESTSELGESPGLQAHGSRRPIPIQAL